MLRIEAKYINLRFKCLIYRNFINVTLRIFYVADKLWLTMLIPESDIPALIICIPPTSIFGQTVLILQITCTCFFLTFHPHLYQYLTTLGIEHPWIDLYAFYRFASVIVSLGPIFLSWYV